MVIIWLLYGYYMVIIWLMMVIIWLMIVDSNHHRWRWWFKSANQQAPASSVGFSECSVSISFHHPTDGYESIPINTIFRGMNIQKSQLFWCEQKGYKVLTHCQIWNSFPACPTAERPCFGLVTRGVSAAGLECWSVSQSNEYTQWRIILRIVSGS